MHLAIYLWVKLVSGGRFVHETKELPINCKRTSFAGTTPLPFILALDLIKQRVEEVVKETHGQGPIASQGIQIDMFTEPKDTLGRQYQTWTRGHWNEVN